MISVWNLDLTSETRIPPAIRRFVHERAAGCCEYCRSQARFSTEPFVVEHIQPRVQGGATLLENLALACSGCNGHKGRKIEAIDPATGLWVGLFNPRRQQWNDHFSWSDDTTEVVGVSSCGRATLEALNLNRRQLINLRRVLHQAGEHPPASQ